MFIRKVTKKFKDGGTEYVQHRLVEAVRTPQGPRQRVILNLGTLEIPEEQHKNLADTIEALLSSQPGLPAADPGISGLARHFTDLILRKRQAEEAAKPIERPAEFTGKPQYETIDLNTVETSAVRIAGPEHAALSQLKALSFMELIGKLGFDGTMRQNAAAQVVARMVHPSAERETASYLRGRSGLDELLGADFSRMSDNALHRVADLLLKHQDEIELSLSQKSRDLFSLGETLILYDLTNTYFESPKSESEIAKYGASKEKRFDCPLVTLALVIDGNGFPKRSRLFAGNAGEPGTLEEMLAELEKAAPAGEKARPTVVFDAGLASDENLKRIREGKKYDYVAVSRRRTLEPDLVNAGEWREVALPHKRTLRLKMARVGDETFVLCHSAEREAKEQEIVQMKLERFEGALKNLKEGLSKPGAHRDYGKIIERIGRLKERYHTGSSHQIEVKQEDGKAIDITWTRTGAPCIPAGHYVLRTTRTDLTDSDISALHRTLVKVEDSFRWLKSDLGLRPNFHQLDLRMKAHIFISVLAYFFLASAMHRLRASKRPTSIEKSDLLAVPDSWAGIVEILSTHVRVTTSFINRQGDQVDVRTTARPTAKQQEVYRRLGITPYPLPRVILRRKIETGLKENVVPKESSPVELSN